MIAGRVFYAQICATSLYPKSKQLFKKVDNFLQELICNTKEKGTI